LPEAFAIGPLLIATRPIAILASLLLAVWLAGRIANRTGLDTRWVRRVAETTAVLGLVGARLGYVMVNWNAFRADPWTALYFWQPGYSAYYGILTGAAYAFWRLARRPLAERWTYLRALGGGYAAGALLTVAVLGTGTVRPGERPPNFSLVDLEGNPVQLADLRGRAVVLNFWATWCPPCRREMPLLDAFHREFASRGLTVVGLDVGEPLGVVKPFVRSMGVDYPIWLDGPDSGRGSDSTVAVHQRFGGVGLPTTAFIDRDGVVRDTHVGELNRAILEDRARELLAR